MLTSVRHGDWVSMLRIISGGQDFLDFPYIYIYICLHKEGESVGIELSSLNSKDKYKCFLNYPVGKRNLCS